MIEADEHGEIFAEGAAGNGSVAGCEAAGGPAKPVSDGSKRPADGAKRASAASKKGIADPELEAIAGDAPAIKHLIEDFDGELFKEKK
jgi:hypothetical protein